MGTFGEMPMPSAPDPDHFKAEGGGEAEKCRKVEKGVVTLDLGRSRHYTTFSPREH
jgi:hypothetical protein